jgi:hypothetical protein
LLDRHAQPNSCPCSLTTVGGPTIFCPCLAWLRRYLDEKEPTLKSFGKVVREPEPRQRDE